MTAAYPLAGLRVLDLSTEIAGPYCTKLLVDAGAEVIKVEGPAGDPLRRWTSSGAAIPPGEDGAFFQHLNGSKRSVVADLQTAAGRALVLDLAGVTDIVVESFAPGTLSGLGLGLAELQVRNPALSLVSISPWGSSGPWVDRPATEFTLQAEIGSIAYRGLRDRAPVAAGGRIGEWVAGSYAAVGALVAWLAARSGGTGHHVDLSMFESMVVAMTVYHDLNGQWRKAPLARAIEIPSIEPAKDGWVGFTTTTSQQWTDFCLLIGHPEVGENPHYLQGPNRMDDLPFMQEIIHGWTLRHTVDEVIELATQFRIPVGPIGNGKTLPAIDQFAERHVYTTGPGGFLRPRPPYQFEKLSLRPIGRAPKLGEHTDEVLRELQVTSPLLTGSVAQNEPHPSRRSQEKGPPHGERKSSFETNLDTARPEEPPFLGGVSKGADAATGPASLPLQGLRIVDLTTFWAGPLAAAHLALLGADVVKVESVQRPDLMRLAGAVPNDPIWEWSAVFAGANFSKRGITLNLATPEGNGLLRRLIENADIVIDNYSARVLDNFGLAWERVHALNPRIIMLRMPAFGLDGPWRDRPGFGQTVEQISGLGWITGYEDLPLVPRGVCDPLAGLHAIMAVLLALEHRHRTGEGQLVELPLVETALNVAAEQVIEYSAYGQLLTRQGNRGPYAAPQGVYPCADQDEYVAIAVATDTQWAGLRRALGDPAWTRDAALASAAGRRAAHDRIDAHIEHWLSTLGRDAAVATLLAAGVPAAPLVNAHFIMPNPQLEHRPFFHIMTHPVTGETRYPGLPMTISGLDTQLHWGPPPTLGQHNEEILCGDLGLSRDEFEDLRRRKIIGTRPVFM